MNKPIFTIADSISKNVILSTQYFNEIFPLNNQTFDVNNLSIYNELLSETGQLIFKKKKKNQFSNDFIPIFQNITLIFREEMNQFALRYESQLFEKDLLSF